MPELIERKFIDLKDLKVSDDGPGTIEGYRAVFSEIDEGGDIIVKGFFADSLPEYMEAGFSAHSHDWDFDKVVGFPVEAKEDEYGFFVKSQFHSTPDSQNIRTKAKERMDAGKKVGFSFGYTVAEKSVVEAKDYKEQLSQYIKSDRLAVNLKKAQKFDRIRILKKAGEMIEDSIVTAPMNKMAGATAIKSGTKELNQQVKELLAAHGDEKIVERINQELNDPDSVYLKGITGTESLESFEAAGTALQKFAQQMRSNHEIRVKEGRMMSSSNRAKVQACMDKIMELHTELSDLMSMSEPKPKEKAFDVIALRTQHDRVSNRLITMLTQ